MTPIAQISAKAAPAYISRTAVTMLAGSGTLAPGDPARYGCGEPAGWATGTPLAGAEPRGSGYCTPTACEPGAAWAPRRACAPPGPEYGHRGVGPGAPGSGDSGAGDWDPGGGWPGSDGVVGRCVAVAQENPSAGLLRVCSSSRAWWAPIRRATEDGQNATADGPVVSVPPAIMPDSARSDGRAAGSLARHAAITGRSRDGTPSRTGR